MFCKNCSNFMDITNNIAIIETEPIEEIISDNINKFDLIESSDYNISSDFKIKKESSITENDIIDILSGKDLPILLENYNFDNLNKIPYYNKLDTYKKTLVINKLQEKLPKNMKIPKNIESSNKKDSYFYCKKCGYHELIPNKMFIFSRTNLNSNEDEYDTKFLNYKYDNTLPFTKNYVCINNDCLTHKEPKAKKAVFYRQGESYVIKYICTVCDAFWNTTS
jgi:hypothetical protein